MYLMLFFILLIISLYIVNIISSKKSEKARVDQNKRIEIFNHISKVHKSCVTKDQLKNFNSWKQNILKMYGLN